MTKIRTTNFDAVLASAPNDIAAGRVVGSGVHYEPTITLTDGRNLWQTCPALKSFGDMTLTGQLYMARMIGKRVGRLVVVGVYANSNPNKGAQWVVRCDCGCFTTRKAKSLNSPRNNDDRCAECSHVEAARINYRRLGPRPIEDFTGGK